MLVPGATLDGARLLDLYAERVDGALDLVEVRADALTPEQRAEECTFCMEPFTVESPLELFRGAASERFYATLAAFAHRRLGAGDARTDSFEWLSPAGRPALADVYHVECLFATTIAAYKLNMAELERSEIATPLIELAPLLRVQARETLGLFRAGEDYFFAALLNSGSAVPYLARIFSTAASLGTRFPVAVATAAFVRERLAAPTAGVPPTTLALRARVREALAAAPMARLIARSLAAASPFITLFTVLARRAPTFVLTAGTRNERLAELARVLADEDDAGLLVATAAALFDLSLPPAELAALAGSPYASAAAALLTHALATTPTNVALDVLLGVLALALTERSAALARALERYMRARGTVPDAYVRARTAALAEAARSVTAYDADERARALELVAALASAPPSAESLANAVAEERLPLDVLRVLLEPSSSPSSTVSDATWRELAQLAITTRRTDVLDYALERGTGTRAPRLGGAFLHAALERAYTLRFHQALPLLVDAGADADSIVARALRDANTFALHWLVRAERLPRTRALLALATDALERALATSARTGVPELLTYGARSPLLSLATLHVLPPTPGVAGEYEVTTAAALERRVAGDATAPVFIRFELHGDNSADANDSAFDALALLSRVSAGAAWTALLARARRSPAALDVELARLHAAAPSLLAALPAAAPRSLSTSVRASLLAAQPTAVDELEWLAALAYAHVRVGGAVPPAAVAVDGLVTAYVLEVRRRMRRVREAAPTPADAALRALNVARLVFELAGPLVPTATLTEVHTGLEAPTAALEAAGALVYASDEAAAEARVLAPDWAGHYVARVLRAFERAFSAHMTFGRDLAALHAYMATRRLGPDAMELLVPPLVARFRPAGGAAFTRALAPLGLGVTVPRSFADAARTYELVRVALLAPLLPERTSYRRRDADGDDELVSEREMVLVPTSVVRVVSAHAQPVLARFLLDDTPSTPELALLLVLVGTPGVHDTTLAGGLLEPAYVTGSVLDHALVSGESAPREYWAGALRAAMVARADTDVVAAGLLEPDRARLVWRMLDVLVNDRTSVLWAHVRTLLASRLDELLDALDIDEHARYHALAATPADLVDALASATWSAGGGLRDNDALKRARTQTPATP